MVDFGERELQVNVNSDLDIDITLVQAIETVPGTNGVTHIGITCFGCNGTGHHRN